MKRQSQNVLFYYNSNERIMFCSTNVEGTRWRTCKCIYGYDYRSRKPKAREISSTVYWSMRSSCIRMSGPSSQSQMIRENNGTEWRKLQSVNNTMCSWCPYGPEQSGEPARSTQLSIYCGSKQIIRQELICITNNLSQHHQNGHKCHWSVVIETWLLAPLVCWCYGCSFTL